MPILWKYDAELGIAFFCPFCKIFQCRELNACSECGGKINWKSSQQYTGKVKWV